MAYTLDDFCSDCRMELKSGKPLDQALSRIAGKLSQLLVNEDFVKATFKPEDDFPKKVLFHDPDLDFYVLAHVHHGPKEGSPHSHGTSWAIYGTAMGVTGMKEWRRVNPPSEEAAVLEVSDQYDLTAGKTRAYGPHVIHSTMHSGKAWVVRVSGTDLDDLPRYRFKKGRDTIRAAT
jgi:predicted metal-dependent enzyme (double-stranded beta helix superfamily)